MRPNIDTVSGLGTCLDLVSVQSSQAKTGETITPDAEFMMGVNKISVKTLDLNKDFKEIAEQLDKIVKDNFNSGAA